MNWNRTIFIFFIYLLSSTSSSASIDTLGTYTDLRLYTGVSDTIYIDHPRYYGTFYRDSCLLEDFGTTLRSSSMWGVCWKRITNNYSPRFWEIGGGAPDNLIGSTVTTETDAINSAAIAAYNAGGDTVEIDSMYEIDRFIFLISHNTYLGIGDSVGFIRKNTPKTVLTSPAKLGDDSILVENNRGFRTRDKINIVNDQAFDSIAGFISYTAYVPDTTVNDSVIYLLGRTMQKDMNAGDSIGLFFAMMRPRFTQLDSVYLKNLVFNGNRSSYTLNYDWRVATTIMLSSTNEAIVEDCRFYETPSENMFLCGATFKNCYGEGLNGSILHFSCQPRKYVTTVLYNNFKNVNEVSDSVIAHSEGGFTFSAKVRNLRMAYNYIEGIGEHGVGRFTHDDFNNEITDNLFNTNKDEVNFIPFYRFPDSNLVYNNKNLNKRDTTLGNCITKTPEPRGMLSCNGNSSLNAPLNLGDILTLSIDSLQVLNSNENFLKSIQAVIDTTYFELEDMWFQTSNLSSFHRWVLDSTFSAKSLVFDNGHQNGIYGKGNWGYERCGEPGGCDSLSISFKVTNLPTAQQAVACPLKGLNINYDSELNTWDTPVTCTKQQIQFDSITIGRPILKRKLVTNLDELYKRQKLEWSIYPNPVHNYLDVVVNSESNEIEYKIYNTLGALQKEGKIGEGKVEVSNLANGIYFIELLFDGATARKSFVKNSEN